MIREVIITSDYKGNITGYIVITETGEKECYSLYTVPDSIIQFINHKRPINIEQTIKYTY